MHLTGSTVEEKLSEIDSYIVILKFISQGRDEIFSCGIHHNMYPLFGYQDLEAFPRKKLFKNIGGPGSPLRQQKVNVSRMSWVTVKLLSRPSYYDGVKPKLGKFLNSKHLKLATSLSLNAVADAPRVAGILENV